jgi:hypothetical protein
MPDHVHLVIRRHRDIAEEMIQHFQEESKKALIETDHRAVNHPVWGGPGWKVFLNSRQRIEETIEYIRANPTALGRPEQHWPFVKAYDGWMPRL